MATRQLTSKDVAHIPKFNGTNFTNWKFQLFLVLEHCKVSKIVLGEEKKPLPVLDSGHVTNAEDIEPWVDKDESARIGICGTLEVKWQSSLLLIAEPLTTCGRNCQVNLNKQQQKISMHYFNASLTTGSRNNIV